MIILYLLLIIALSIFEIRSLKKNGQIKDIFVFLGCMVIAAAFGIVFFPKSLTTQHYQLYF